MKNVELISTIHTAMIIFNRYQFQVQIRHRFSKIS